MAGLIQREGVSILGGSQGWNKGFLILTQRIA